MPLQIRRGTNAERTAMTGPLAPGELVFTTDTKRLYIGDGTTVGGVGVTGYNDQDAKDAAAALFTGSNGGTYDGISFTYNRAGGNISSALNYEKVRDAAASLFTNPSGTYTGITFTYNQAGGWISAVVTGGGGGGILSVSQDTNPSLGGNLNLATNTINGSGNINITGNITASGYLSNGRIKIDGSTIKSLDSQPAYINIGNTSSPSAVIITTQSDSNLTLINLASASNNNGADLSLTSSNGTLTSPTALNVGDSLGSVIFNGYVNIPSLGVQPTTLAGITSKVYAVTDGSSAPTASVAIRLANGPNPANAKIFRFDPTGVFSTSAVSVGDGSVGSPSIAFTTDGGTDTGFSHPGDGIIVVGCNAVEVARFDSGGFRSSGFIKVAQVNGTLPNPPEAGMIVLDGTTFKGYNGSAWVNLN